jgi:hypothetical protein
MFSLPAPKAISAFTAARKPPNIVGVGAAAGLVPVAAKLMISWFGSKPLNTSTTVDGCARKLLTWSSVTAVASGPRIRFAISLAASAPMSGLPPNPFGNSVELLPVSYVDQTAYYLNPSSNSPTPVLQAYNLLPAPSAVTASGLTIELWFKASTPGILVAHPMVSSTATILAPLLYIDPNGFLTGGLFQQGEPLTGGANAIASPLSVLDGDWHHAALTGDAARRQRGRRAGAVPDRR